MPTSELIDLAHSVIERYRERGWRLATAESCTGGLVAACLTEIPGSSEVVERGFVTYSNEAKHELLGVSLELLGMYGAVSAEVAEAMAIGALAHAHADVAISLTGIAGPGGATATKPVGLVYLGLALRDGSRPPQTYREWFHGDRATVRRFASERALTLLRDAAPPHSLIA